MKGKGGPIDFESHSTAFFTFSIEIEKESKRREVLQVYFSAKAITVNISLVEALEQMPSYAKFIKDLMMKIKDYEFWEFWQFSPLYAIASHYPV